MSLPVFRPLVGEGGIFGMPTVKCSKLIVGAPLLRIPGMGSLSCGFARSYSLPWSEYMLSSRFCSCCLLYFGWTEDPFDVGPAGSREMPDACWLDDGWTVGSY